MQQLNNYCHHHLDNNYNNTIATIKTTIKITTLVNELEQQN